MNIYEKIQVVKEKLLKEKIKKSGYNKFAGFNYYELADLTPFIIKYCNENKLFTAVKFDKELATLLIVNAEEPTEKIEYTSPMEELELKGCNKVQALGGTETYQRRYLYMSAFDIIESDTIDAVSLKEPSEIGKVKIEALKKSIENNAIEEDKVTLILNEYGYKKLEDIKEDKYMEIVEKLKKIKGA